MKYILFVCCWVMGYTLNDTEIISLLISAWKPPPNATLQTTSILLENYNITGTLPGMIGNLSGLKYLNLHHNNFSGTIPTEWSALTNLLFLGLGRNYLSGTLPSRFSTMTALTWIEFSTNNLTGTLPPEWGDMTQVTYFGGDNNHFEGTIPSQWFLNWKQLQYFTVFNNWEISGTLPSFISPTVTILEFSNTKISGTIPFEWNSLQNLNKLWLPSTTFGCFPYCASLSACSGGEFHCNCHPLTCLAWDSCNGMLIYNVTVPCCGLPTDAICEGGTWVISSTTYTINSPLNIKSDLTLSQAATLIFKNTLTMEGSMSMDNTTTIEVDQEVTNTPITIKGSVEMAGTLKLFGSQSSLTVISSSNSTGKFQTVLLNNKEVPDCQLQYIGTGLSLNECSLSHSLGSNTGAIVGGIVGGVFFIVMVIGIVYWVYQYQEDKKVLATLSVGSNNGTPVKANE